MRKIQISAKDNNFITTGEAKALLKKNKIKDNSVLKGMQKYGIRGSRMTYYLVSDVSKAIELLTCRETDSTARKAVDDTPADLKDVRATHKQTVENRMRLTAYVDGSFNKATGVYGSAAIIVSGDEVIATATSSGTKMNSMRNVAGEIAAAALAVKTAEQLLPDELVIMHDYEGVGKWPTGAWKTKNEYTSKYAAFMNKQRSFPISYEHVKAHTGNKYNEMADDMALKAAGLTAQENAQPQFTGMRNDLNNHIRLIKYQVCSSCLNDITAFYMKGKRAFRDYVALRCHTSDNLSALYEIEKFKSILTSDEINYVTENLADKRDIMDALRWTARGLDVEDAVRKANIDSEIYKNKGM